MSVDSSTESGAAAPGSVRVISEAIRKRLGSTERDVLPLQVWVLPSLTCGYYRRRWPFPLVTEF